MPVELAFAADSGVMYEDVLGENEVRVILATLAGSDEVQTVVPIGWGGDRFRLYSTPEGEALVWYVVWDDQRSGDRFLRSAAGLRSRSRPGYRAALEPVTVGERPGTRFVLAPAGWERWGGLPGWASEDGAGRPAPPRFRAFRPRAWSTRMWRTARAAAAKKWARLCQGFPGRWQRRR